MKLNDTNEVFRQERANCKSIPDDLIARRIELYKRLSVENLARVEAGRSILKERYPHIAQNLEEGQEIEDGYDSRYARRNVGKGQNVSANDRGKDSKEG